MRIVGRGKTTNRPVPGRFGNRDDPDGADIFDRRQFRSQREIIRPTPFAALAI